MAMALIGSYVSILVPIGTVSEGLGGVAMLEEMCHWQWTLRFQKRMPFFWLKVDVSKYKFLVTDLVSSLSACCHDP